MKNNLPKVFKNATKGHFNNKTKVYMTKSVKNEEQERTEETIINQKLQKRNYNSINSVEEKLSKLIIRNKHYTYKVPVEIELQDRTIATKIIGKTKNYILTIDNEKIEIGKIKNIIMSEK
jgi:hypothetical protein